MTQKELIERLKTLYEQTSAELQYLEARMNRLEDGFQRLEKNGFAAMLDKLPTYTIGRPE